MPFENLKLINNNCLAQVFKRYLLINQSINQSVYVQSCLLVCFPSSFRFEIRFYKKPLFWIAYFPQSFPLPSFFLSQHRDRSRHFLCSHFTHTPYPIQLECLFVCVFERGVKKTSTCEQQKHRSNKWSKDTLHCSASRMILFTSHQIGTTMSKLKSIKFNLRTHTITTTHHLSRAQPPVE